MRRRAFVVLLACVSFPVLAGAQEPAGGSREIRENSREFSRDKANTIYHAGYPESWRQAGKEPSIQLSMSDAGLRGDIDVDYRSRKTPQGLFNGHLTSANSDVRMGDNAKRQNDQALAFLSPRAYACLNLDDEGSSRSLDAAAARRELRRLMEYSGGKLRPVPNLTSAMVAVAPRDPQRVIVDHPFRREFVVMPLEETLAQSYLCGGSTSPPSGAEYFAVVFQFRRPGGGTLGLLWTRESG